MREEVRSWAHAGQCCRPRPQWQEWPASRGQKEGRPAVTVLRAWMSTLSRRRRIPGRACHGVTGMDPDAGGPAVCPSDISGPGRWSARSLDGQQGRDPWWTLQDPSGAGGRAGPRGREYLRARCSEEETREGPLQRGHSLLSGASPQFPHRRNTRGLRSKSLSRGWMPGTDSSSTHSPPPAPPTPSHSSQPAPGARLPAGGLRAGPHARVTTPCRGR